VRVGTYQYTGDGKITVQKLIYDNTMYYTDMHNNNILYYIQFIHTINIYVDRNCDDDDDVRCV